MEKKRRQPTLKSQPQSLFLQLRRRLESYQPSGSAVCFLYELLLFGIKQAWASLFGGLMLALLLCTHLYYPEDYWLARYDFLTLGAIGIQLAMLVMRLETLAEARVILIFHGVGTVMEIFKTAQGSWIYPEPSVLRIADVPLFSGFMYAAVGSYIARVWRIFAFRFDHYPKTIWAQLLALAIYINFFAHHWLPDIRWLLFAVLFVLFLRTRITFTIWREPRWMPLIVGWFLVAVFIWFAENVGTFANAWVYPNQSGEWQMVSPQKLGSWYLLMYISFVLVALARDQDQSVASTTRNSAECVSRTN